MRVYIAGKMTGVENFNYPAFNKAAAELRAMGYEVENPAENPEQPSWEGYLKQAIRQMLTCDAVALLPDWMDSKGARIEFDLAKQLGMEVRTIEAFVLRRVFDELRDERKLVAALTETALGTPLFQEPRS